MPKTSNKTINIGLLGLGTVGTGVVEILRAEAKAIEEKTGLSLRVKKICVKSPGKKRALSVPRGLLTADPRALINDPSIDIFVELIGGVQPAKKLILAALAAGKHVVTANKALLAEQGEAIFKAASARGRVLGYEASVCGGIPILAALRQGLVSNEITHFLGIVNGTCNFILTEMSENSRRFDDALRQAQKEGYAEMNPRLDVEGVDSAHKLAILARLAFRSQVDFKTVHVEGIAGLSVTDIEYAKELGYGIKLLAIGKKMKNGLELRVHPTMLPLDHPLAAVRGVYNAVFVHASQAGDLLFYGKGAGRFPTASAVVSDIVDIAKGMQGCADAGSPPMSASRVLPLDDLKSNYYLRFQVEDRPGVLGRIAETLGRNNISILSVHQKESHHTNSVPVIILTYEAREKDLRKALEAIDSRKEVSRETVVIRVEK